MEKAEDEESWAQQLLPLGFHFEAISKRNAAFIVYMCRYRIYIVDSIYMRMDSFADILIVNSYVVCSSGR